jgi:hypothetical protein
MESIRDDAIGGFNRFLEDQKKQPGRATLTYAQFDTEYELVHDGLPLQYVPALTAETFVPRGSTALLDAMGRTINAVGARLSNTPESQRPGKVIVVILTDGAENASKEFRRDKIKAMVEEQTNRWNWQFIYLAANQDAIAVGQSVGIRAQACAAFVADKAGTERSYRSVSNSVSSYRSSGVIGNLNDDYDKS